MSPPSKKLLIFAGIFTLIQAGFQTAFAAFAIAQHFCVIDFLRQYPILIYIRMLYFHNPSNCGARINIGESIDEIADQAFVLITNQPFTSNRTFIFNCISLSLSILWVLGSVLLIKAGMRKQRSNIAQWPWLVTTLPVTFLDLIAVIAYANDSFHTKTLNEIMAYINGTASGVGNVNVNTRLAAWLMVLIYSRFIVFLLANLVLIISVVVDCTRVPSPVTSPEVERNQIELSEKEESDVISSDQPSHTPAMIPRPGLRNSFRTMKSFLFRTGAHRTGAAANGGRNRHRGVNFTDEIEIPSFENMIVDQQRRLNFAMVDTAGRRSPARAHSFTNLPETSRGRRGTAAELQGQMPWSYIPAATNRMRDQLPPDEDLPPVPLPDYSALQSPRKASVHRAASSLSSMTQKKEYMSYQSPHRDCTLSS